MNKVELQFKTKGIMQPGGWMIISKQDAIDFIIECKKELIEILGIDAFFIRERGIQPSMEHSIDFSSMSTNIPKDRVYDYAENFIRAKDDNMFLEIVCSWHSH